MMAARPELSRLLHDVQSKTASLKSAAQLLKDCPPNQAREMLDLMTKEARELLRCMVQLKKVIPEEIAP
jgi:nitrogen-specific signal transduction histidine kinase